MADGRERLAERRALGQALKRLRKRADMTQEQAAEAAGVVVQSWRRYEWGDRDLTYDQLATLAEAVGGTREDLLEQSAAITTAAGATIASLPPRARPAEGPTTLPIRDRIQAGAWLPADDLDQSEPRRQAAATDPRFPYAEQWLSEVVGDSVDQLRIFSGDLVHCVDAIGISYFPKTGDVVEVVRRRFQGAERELTIKQVEVTADGDWLLWPRSSNPRWRDPLEITAGMREAEDSEIRIRGLVLAVVRRIA